jgi:hypothetical protein
MVASTKMIAFWDDAPCSLLEIYCFSEALSHRPACSSSRKHPRNVDKFLRDYTEQHFRRKSKLINTFLLTEYYIEVQKFLSLSLSLFSIVRIGLQQFS